VLIHSEMLPELLSAMIVCEVIVSSAAMSEMLFVEISWVNQN
jgi:hypothetical protein